MQELTEKNCSFKNNVTELNASVSTDKSTRFPIVEALKNACKNPSVQFHIPGHTKGKGILPEFKELIGDRALFLDTTDEFDNLGTLHPATGPIKEAQELAAEAFGAAKSYFLINGSTVGNMAIAMSSTKIGQKVIVNRNCHRSILTGLIMSGASPLWLMPKKLEEWGIWGNTEAQEVESLLEQNPDASMVWITNPTYEGIVSDISAISAICKKYNVPLIVDEAHGCLWIFNEELPSPALKQGADAVVHSLHKTGGSMSQSSMLHIAKHSKLNIDNIEKTLKLLHTTSPSYTLLASLDAARANLTSQKGLLQIEQAVINAKRLRQRLSQIPNVKCLSADENINIDPTKIYIMVKGLSGKRLESILEFEHNIEVESATDKGVLALSNIGNTTEEIDYFCNCIENIANSHHSDICYLEKIKYMPLSTPVTISTPREAFYAEKETIPTKDAIGRISAEVIAECPPGISVLMPGEVIRDEHMPYLIKYETLEVLK